MAMSIQAAAANPELGWYMARLIPLLRNADPRNDISIRLRPFMGEDFRDAFYPGTADYTNMYLGFDRHLAVAILDGVEDNIQAAGLVAGYRHTDGLLSLNGRNDWLVNASRVLFGNITNRFALFGTPDLLVVGYSAGGAIGTWILKRYTEAFGMRFQRLITFGSPRAMNPDDRAAITRCDICRWMVDADPIPLLPPRAEDAPLLFLSFTLPQAITYGTFVHTLGGISINSAGQPLESILPPIAAMDVIGNLTSWFFGVERSPDNPHWIGNYEDRLEILKRQAEAAASVAGGGSDDEPTANAPRRQLTRAQQATMSQVARVSSEQNVNAVAIAAPSLFKAVRFGRVWSVEFAGQLFAFSGNKKRARHLARVGNELLRSFPKQAVMDPESFLSTMTQYFNAAILPGGPSNPPINIGL